MNQNLNGQTDSDIGGRLQRRVGPIVALHKTVGNREVKHCCVLYIAANKDWGARQLARNGNHGMPLAIAEHTAECDNFRSASHRARSLQYSGVKPADEAGFIEDLAMLGFDGATIDRFVAAAKPCWPNSVMTGGKSGQSPC